MKTQVAIAVRNVSLLIAALVGCLPASACTSIQSTDEQPTERSQGSSLAIGKVILRGIGTQALHQLPDDATTYTNGIDTFYTTKQSDGGTFVLYRYAPPTPTIVINPYPEIVLPGTKAQYVKPISASPFYRKETIVPPFKFAAPYSQLKWPALLADSGTGIVFVAESPVFEEATERFVSAYPAIDFLRDTTTTLRLRFGERGPAPTAINLQWAAIERTASTTTYTAPLVGLRGRALAIHVPHAITARRVWYHKGAAWEVPLTTQHGGLSDPDLLILDVNQPDTVLVESEGEPPAGQASVYAVLPGYVHRARWSAFTVYSSQVPDRFFSTSITPSMKAYNDRSFGLRDDAAPPSISNTWRDLLQKVGFTKGKNELNPKFFDVGFPVAGDPLFEADPNLRISVSWVSDEAALQAAMGRRLFGFAIDPRYAQGVSAFYDPKTSFYFGAYKRAPGKFTSADTGSDGIVIGYNYLLSLARLTELVGTPVGLPANDTRALVDRAIGVLQPGYLRDYKQIPYLWRYPSLEGLQWEYGMGKELSEAQLSYVCGLWWLQTNEQRYRDCQVTALRLPEEVALTLQGSSYLWGLDVVHGGYVIDALLLAYKTTGARHYLDAALTGWREELLFLFSDLNYPETPFDDRGMTVTSYSSTFADLHQGNYWRGDAWNNSRVLWSLSKLLAYVDDPRIAWQLAMARETHKQSMPTVDKLYNPIQRSTHYNIAIDPNDFELSYEDLRSHYSTQIAYSNDVWREASIFESIGSTGAAVYRIPGVLLSDPGIAYIVGKPNALVALTIKASDVTFVGGRLNTQVRLDASGIARAPLVSR